MSDGITDCRRDEEKKAWEMVEKKCENCDSSIYDECLLCEGHVDGLYQFFRPSKEAISAKIEELRNQASKQDSGSKVDEQAGKEREVSKKKCVLDSVNDCAAILCLKDIIAHLQERNDKLKSEREEMIEFIKSFLAWPSHESFQAYEKEKLREQAKEIIKKAEGK